MSRAAQQPSWCADALQNTVGAGLRWLLVHLFWTWPKAGSTWVGQHMIAQPAAALFAVGAILRVDAPVAQPHCGVTQRPALTLGVHAHRDGGTGAKCGQKQVVRAGAGGGAADLSRLVREQLVAAGGDALAVGTRVRLGDDHHATWGRAGRRGPDA